MSEKRTVEDIKVILNRATPADWHHVQKKLEMTREEILEDPGLLPATLAYFIDRQENGKSVFDNFYHMPEGELTAFLNIDEDNAGELEDSFEDAPKSLEVSTSTPQQQN